MPLRPWLSGLATLLATAALAAEPAPSPAEEALQQALVARFFSAAPEVFKISDPDSHEKWLSFEAGMKAREAAGIPRARILQIFPYEQTRLRFITQARIHPTLLKSLRRVSGTDFHFQLQGKAAQVAVFVYAYPNEKIAAQKEKALANKSASPYSLITSKVPTAAAYARHGTQLLIAFTEPAGFEEGKGETGEEMLRFAKEFLASEDW